MGKIRKMVLGMALAVCVFASSAGSCYAATGSLEVGVTETNAWGNFRYDDPGHHLKVVLLYVEIDAKGNTTKDMTDAHQFGNFISVYVSRPSPAGCKYSCARAAGYVDDVIAATAPWMDAK